MVDGDSSTYGGRACPSEALAGSCVSHALIKQDQVKVSFFSFAELHHLYINEIRKGSSCTRDSTTIYLYNGDVHCPPLHPS
jgi:hypothetical protein